MSNVFIIARKEMRDIARNRFFLTLFAALCFTILMSIIVSAIDFHSKVADYQTYLTALRSAGGTVQAQPPQLYPLTLLIGSLEYLEIIGALLALILGYGLIAKEKTRGTLQLLFSRPLSGHEFAAGKLLSLAWLWLLFCAAIGIATTAILLVIGGASLTSTDILRLFITLAMSWLYLLFWSSVGMGLASYTKQLTTALIVGLVLWLGVVLILPQIGDTMDPDNQIPGGLFNSLHIDRPRQQAVMAHFTGYESSRNYIETASVEKHFERAAFGFTGVKDIYNQKPIPYVLQRLWPNMLAVILWALAGVGWALSQTSKKRLLRKESI